MADLPRKLLVFPHREAIGYLGGFSSRKETSCWIAIFKGQVPESAKGVKPRFFAFLEFDDVDNENIAYNFGLLPLEEEEALWAAQILIKALKSGCKEFIFSCDAGRSRSAGLAEGFADFLREQNIPFQKAHHRPLFPTSWYEKDFIKLFKKLLF